jgi:signal transduction histidine kinase
MPLVIFHLGSQVSALFKYAPGAAFYYLPTSMGIILINWWGPKRVVPAIFLNAIISAHLWDVGPWYLWPLYALPETIFVFTSWYLFSYRGKGKYWMPNINELVSFLILGVIIPLLLEILLLEFIYISTGERPADQFFFTFIRSSLGEFISNFGLTLPVLYYLTGWMKERGWLLYTPPLLAKPYWPVRKHWINIAITYTVLFFMSWIIPFHQYWFLFGIFSLFMAIRYGFGLAVLTNLYIFLLTYLVPLVANQFFGREQSIHEDVVNIYLGTSLLYVFSAITGQVISDLRMVKRRIVEQLHKVQVANKELEITNQELDRFAYSVSHDLSAPLKSISGLINISRMTTNLADHQLYFNKIELSVNKLDTFIHEILDYSRNKRQVLIIESVNLEVMCREVLENLQYIPGFEKVKVEMEGLKVKEVVTDKARLKMIINNILTNAFKYQKQLTDHQPVIKLSSQQQTNGVQLQVEDNGEGMTEDVQKRIFNMFFRGNQQSKGSGLGLYIAREAAARIKSTISVSSEYGRGTVFTLDLQNLVP